MKRTPLSAVLLAVTALAACRQLAGLDDRPGLHDAGAELTSASTDAATNAPFCARTDASFCEDFEGRDLDAGWSEKIDSVDDAGPAGMLIVGADGFDSAQALHATGLGTPTQGFHDSRLTRSFSTSAQRVSLSFSIFVHGVSFAHEDDLVQLALLIVPGAIAYPALGARGLSFHFTTTDNAYVEHASETFFDFDAWHQMTLVYDLQLRTIEARIDGKEAMPPSPFAPSGNTGGYGIAIGLRMQGNSTAVEVRYDDVVVELQ